MRARPPSFHRCGRAAVVTAVLAGLVLTTGCTRLRVAPMAPGPPVRIGDEETGPASWYGAPYHGRRASSGEIYDMNQMTAAHRTLPFSTWLLVENLRNGRTVEVRVNDRGPFVGARILDLSYAAARVLGATGPGVIPVRLRVIAGPAAAPRDQASGFTIQIGAFGTSEHAAALLRELGAADGPPGRVEAVEAGGRTIFRVRVGHFARRAEAEDHARRLAARGYTVLIVGAE